MSESAKHIPALDGVRGLAVTAVFFYHYGGGVHSSNAAFHFLGEAIHFGWAGVSLFFVLSGFLISGILWDSFSTRGWWSRFYWRRSLRIFPLYYLALAIAVAGALWTVGANTQLLYIWPRLLYLQNVPSLYPLMAHFATPMKLFHLWSLAVEEQFYLIWPFLLVLLRNKPGMARWTCIGVWILSLLYRLAIYHAGLDREWAISFLPGRAGELALGSYLALAIRDERSNWYVQRSARIIFSASLMFAVLMMLWSKGTGEENFPMATFGIAINAILFASVIALCLGKGRTASLFEMPWLRWLGKISYGIYVYHILLARPFEWIVFRTLPHLGRNAHLVAVAIVAAIGTLAVASLSFYGFESRFLRRKNLFSARQAVHASS